MKALHFLLVTPEQRRERSYLWSTLAAVCMLAVACAPATSPSVPASSPMLRHSIIPIPASVELTREDPFVVIAETRIRTPPGSAEAEAIGAHLARLLRPSTGWQLSATADAGQGSSGSIALELNSNRADLGEEGYELISSADSVVLRAREPAGLFWGFQTLRQLLPAAVEGAIIQPGPWTIPAGRIVDQPRFVWRGAMLDVARHFFSVEEVKRYIDLIALYKINRLHLHLSDDQGWRIMIDSWPKLATYGGTKEVGDGSGGYYTQEEYAEIVNYAGERFITVVPEIDLPGHTNAALASYAELNCDNVARPLYSGTEVGFSAVCVDKEDTYRFVDDVVRELAALTPGPFIHIGGDEVETLTHEAYARFIERVQGIVTSHGKRMVGWEEVTKAELLPTTIVQQWKSDSAQAAVQYGAKLILSPASKVYLDMKYNPNTELGLKWAGYVDVRDAYDWDPATLMQGVAESDIIGVEAPIWTETLTNMGAVEFMAFPRLPAVAEIGWSPADRTEWEEFRLRLAAQTTRWHLLGVNYYRSPQIPWVP